jgi:hypothetical protein
MVLIRLYPDVYTRLPNTKNIYTKEDFKKILAPYKWVDWLNSDLKSKFSGGGEKGRSNLYVWMFDALKIKISHPREIVMAKNRKSKPGEGILSPPDKSPIIIKAGNWPSGRKTMTFESKRPINARTKAEWRFYDDSNTQYFEIISVIHEDERSICVVNPNDLFNDIKYFKIEVLWINANEPAAKSEIKINKSTR